MRNAHLTPETLRDLLSKDRDELENRFLLHHLAVCPECASVGGYLLELFEIGALDLRFCVVDAEIAHSRMLAPGLLEELRALPAPEAERQVRESTRYHSWGLVEELCRASRGEAPDDVERAVSFASLAVQVAGSLPEWQPADNAWLLELRAFALAHLASARRVAGDLPSANAAMREAERDWTEGFLGVGGDVMGYFPTLLAMKATIRLEERRFQEALALFAKAEAADERGLLKAEILVGVARVHETSGDLDQAIKVLREAEEAASMLPARIHLVIRHNLLWIETSREDFEAAAALLPEVRALAARFGGALDHLRLDWAEARIEAGFGRPGATDLYEAVRRGFLDRKLGYDTALVTLELAVVYAERGEARRVRKLASDLAQVFRAQGVPREALAALLIFVRTAERTDLPVAYLLRLRTYLKEARRDPDLPFPG